MCPPGIPALAQAPFEFTISLATMRPGWEVECTEGGWLVVVRRAWLECATCGDCLGRWHSSSVAFTTLLHARLLVGFT